jgi:hypothetical protein
MSDVPGIDQDVAILARLRGELRKTILDAAQPRAFTDWAYPASGGYDFDTASYSDHWPAHWTNGALAVPSSPPDATEDDPLCPILEAYGWRDLETDEVIDAAPIAPFTQADLRDTVDATADTLKKGCGFLLVNVDDDPVGVELLSGGHGRSAGIIQPVRVEITGRLPAGRRRDQAHFYCAMLHRVLRHARIKLSSTAYVEILEPPTTGEVTAEEPWLEFLYVAPAWRHWQPPYPFSP